MEKSYRHQQVESRCYQLWLERSYFHASVTAGGEPYSMVIPPPNITGSLHMGHALNSTLQDILIRWRRMQGRNTLWVPGTDHAGIATQNVVERRLLADEGRSREELGREQFLQRIEQWRAQYGGTIIEQLQRLGASCDWSRLRFTLDEGLSRAVREVFVRLYEDGLIYRGERLINWCPHCLTALSDIEVEHEETTGKLYHLAYPLADDPARALTVATTRPETMLGDTAVAVHPEDPRYNALIGREVRLPLTNRTIPIVGDAMLVDREFGSGAVKITPAHDFNDFEAGLRHQLPRIAILDQHARMAPTGLAEALVEAAWRSQLVGKSTREARAIVVEALAKDGRLLHIDDHKMALGKCYRCKTVVEPYLSPQWFVKIQPLAAPAIQAVEDGLVRFIPEQWTNNYLGWMRDIKDWCISRQIWWGHQIPAWYCRACDDATPLVAREKPARCPRCGHGELVQDPDVLDTWFSSALWPFSTLGWPERTPELATYYPTSTLVTGFDILFFWVARMIMMGLKFTGQVPFRDVYIHALVRDPEGQKMSKSKGNVIDPLEVMEKYGTDALRFTLAAMASPGRDIRLSEERIEGYRNFANKLWNAARFLRLHLEGPRENAPLSDRPPADQWIMSRLQRAISDVTKALETYRFDEAANRLYHFIWHEYCDWYLEFAKPALADKDSRAAALTRTTLVESFDNLLRLLHPFMPFITEELWQAISHGDGRDSIMVQRYPTPDSAAVQDAIEEEILCVQQVVSAVRYLRGMHAIPASRKLSLSVSIAAPKIQQILNTYGKAIRMRAGLSDLRISADLTPPGHAVGGAIVFTGGHPGDLWVERPGALIQADQEMVKKETAQKEKRLQELRGQMQQDETKLSNPEFVAKAPPAVLQKTRARYEECRLEHEKLTDELRRLEEIAEGKR